MIQLNGLLHVQNRWMFQIIKWTRCDQFNLLIVNRRRNTELSRFKTALLINWYVKTRVRTQSIDQRLVIAWVFNTIADQQTILIQLVGNRQYKSKREGSPRFFIITQLKNYSLTALFHNLKLPIAGKTMLRLMIDLALIFVLIIFEPADKWKQNRCLPFPRLWITLPQIFQSRCISLNAVHLRA